MSLYLKTWPQRLALLAGLYNLLWGALAIIFPRECFTLLGAQVPSPIELWQCIGMIVGAYGIGYIIGARDPKRYWPLFLVGLIGKIAGPLGMVMAVIKGIFPLNFCIHILFNDLIWWIPFGLILREAFKGPTTTTKLYEIDELGKMGHRYQAQFINSLSGFKSANLLGSVSADGKHNLAIVSSAFHLGANPPLLGLVMRPDSVPRHTLLNVRETKLLTLNHVHPSFIQKAHQTSARYAREISEFTAVGLTPQFLKDHKAPFVAESSHKVALELVREITLEENGTHLLICKILFAAVPEKSVQRDGHVQIDAACVSGLDHYHTPDSGVRFSYAKEDRPTYSFR